MARVRELSISLSQFPRDLVDLVDGYASVCEVCERVRPLLEKHLPVGSSEQVEASEKWEYCDTLTFRRSSADLVSLDYDSQTGTCELCQGEEQLYSDTSFEELLMVVAHRLELCTLLRGGSYDPDDMDQHRTVGHVSCQGYDGADRIGLNFRADVLDESEKEQARLQYRFRRPDYKYDDESDAKSVDTVYGESDYSGPVIPGLPLVPVDQLARARSSDSIDELGDVMDAVELADAFSSSSSSSSSSTEPAPAPGLVLVGPPGGAHWWGRGGDELAGHPTAGYQTP